MAAVRKTISKRLVTETFRKNYREKRRWDTAWNATLDQLATEIRKESLRRTRTARPQEAERRDIAEILNVVIDQVLLEEGDPMTVFVNSVLQELREAKVFAALEAEDKKGLCLE